MALAGMHPRTVGRSTPASGYFFYRPGDRRRVVECGVGEYLRARDRHWAQHDRLTIAAFEDWVFGAVANGASSAAS
jgi:hypothetical protein